MPQTDAVSWHTGCLYKYLADILYISLITFLVTLHTDTSHTLHTCTIPCKQVDHCSGFLTWPCNLGQSSSNTIWRTLCHYIYVHYSTNGHSVDIFTQTPLHLGRDWWDIYIYVSTISHCHPFKLSVHYIHICYRLYRERNCVGFFQ